MLKLFIHAHTHTHTHTLLDLKLTMSDEWTHVDDRRNGGDKSPAMPLPHECCIKIFGALRGHQHKTLRERERERERNGSGCEEIHTQVIEFARENNG